MMKTLEGYAGWCEEEAACRLQLANLRDAQGDYYTDDDTYLVTGEAACWLTAANLARGAYTEGAWE